MIKYGITRLLFLFRTFWRGFIETLHLLGFQFLYKKTQNVLNRTTYTRLYNTVTYELKVMLKSNYPNVVISMMIENKFKSFNLN